MLKPDPSSSDLHPATIPPPPCISYANVRNYYGPYTHCSLDKGVACAQHIQLPTHTCAHAWYECTSTSAHISKCMQTQESLGNMKFSGSLGSTSPGKCWVSRQSFAHVPCERIPRKYQDTTPGNGATTRNGDRVFLVKSRDSGHCNLCLSLQGL